MWSLPVSASFATSARRGPISSSASAQPTALSNRESFRAFAEFDAERAELFLARAALLVEGRTEKLAFPFVFSALGYDPDREGVAVVDCGGKGNQPLFARICNECGIPYVVVHDRDAPADRWPVESERIANKRILEAAGRRRTVQLVPDFEAVSGLTPSRTKAVKRTVRLGKSWACAGDRESMAVNAAAVSAASLIAMSSRKVLSPMFYHVVRRRESSRG